MGDAKTTIELNGKKYDARTGKIIEDNSVNVVKVATSSPVHKPVHKVVDGFVKPSKQSVTHHVAIKTDLPKPAVARANANHAKRQLSKSSTLMRPSVKKPAIKNDIQKVRYVAKQSHVETARINKAQNTAKSPLISRFGQVSLSSTIKKTAEHLPLVSPPEAFASAGRAVNSELEKFENSIKNATAHMQQLEKDMLKKAPFLSRVGFRNKAANLATMSFAALLLVGFFGYQNSAYISMKVAASRAGVTAKVPGYTPAGYSLGKGVESSDGKVKISFISNTDDKSFTLTQQASNWNSTALLANNVQKQTCSTCYQTWQDSGKTVYIYDETNATWVDGGIWYTVEGNALLTSDQLLRLASSL